MPDNYYSEVNENGVVTPFRDLAAYNGVIANTKLIKDTVGWSGKNKAEPLVGYTLSGDGNTGYYLGTGSNAISYIAKIEQGKKYKVTKDSTYGDRFRIVGFVNKPTSTPDNTAYQFVFDNTKTEYEVTNTTYNYLVFTANLNTSTTVSAVKGMIRDADILDDTYEPYFGSTAFPRSEQAVLGAKNIMPYPYVSKTITENNVTFTLNDDGSVTVNTGTGGASATTVFYFCQNYYIKKGNYIVSGCPEGGSLGTYFIQFRRSGDPAIDARDIGNGVNVNIEQNNHFINYIGIVLLTGVELNNKTFKPMLRLATDTDATFVSPAMTNKGLTDKVIGAFAWGDTYNGDYNDLPAGMVFAGSGASHKPDDWCIVKTYYKNGDRTDGFQTAFKINPTTPYIYVRAKASGSWGNWFKFTGVEQT